MDVFFPCYSTFLALIPSQLDTPADVLCDAAIPTSLVYGAVYGLYLVPPLVWDDIW
jgi:hypothetical protein